MPVYVIYDNPSDHPGWFMVRRWDLDLSTLSYEPGNIVGFASKLDHAQAMVPPGCVNLGRVQGEDPTIAEVWL